jgi:hypothetical protein
MKRNLALSDNRKGKRGGSKKSSWIWDLMEPTEIVNADRTTSKSALCKVNTLQIPDTIVNCGMTIRGGDCSTSNYISHLLSAHGLSKDNYKQKIDKNSNVSIKA